MYLTEKAPGEIQITKLSQAIRIGALTVPEDRSWRGCALGTAGVAVGYNPAPVDFCIRELLSLLSDRFGIDVYDLGIISSAHYNGTSRQEIARQLEAQGL